MSCCPKGSAVLGVRHRARVRYGGGRSIVVKGPVTGADYRFSGVDRVQSVDPRDAMVIARHPLFRIEGIVDVTDAPGTSPTVDPRSA
jgi:hypothetical protein